MTNEIPDYSNLKANLSSMNRFFNDQGVKLTASEQAQIKSIFEEANVEKEKDKNVEEQLVGNERFSFMDKIKQTLPNIYSKIVDFITTVEVVEDVEKNQKEALEKLENEKLNQKDTIKSDEKFGLS